MVSITLFVIPCLLKLSARDASASSFTTAPDLRSKSSFHGSLGRKASFFNLSTIASSSIHASEHATRSHGITRTALMNKNDPFYGNNIAPSVCKPHLTAPFRASRDTKLKATLECDNQASSKTSELPFLEYVEQIPLGCLSRKHVSDTSRFMHQLSGTRFRRDEIVDISSSLKGVFANEGTSTNKFNARQRRQIATTVERLLWRLVRESNYHAENHKGNEALQCTNTQTYNFAIKAWSFSNVKGSAEKSERTLKKLLNAYEMGKDSLYSENHFSHLPNLHSFAYCYASWCKESLFAGKLGDKEASTAALRRADAVLCQLKRVLMDNLIRTDHLSQQSRFISEMNSILELWSTSINGSPKSIERWFNFFAKEQKKNNFLYLDTRSYNLMINFWAKSGNSEAMARANDLLSDMEESKLVNPNILSYSGVISTLSKTQKFGDAERAEALLDQMILFNETAKVTLKPDNVIFNQIINLYSKSNSKGSAARCEKLLKRMEDLASSGNFDVNPDIRTYNNILSAWANEEGPAKAEQVLQRINTHHVLRPNSISFVTCMDAYAKVGDVHNTLRILSMMEACFKEGNLDAKPTRRAYTSALNALSKSGRGDAGVKAEALVKTMENMYQDGNLDMKPDTTVYNVLINCHKSSATRAEKILYRMGKRDVVSYSSVIKAYSQMGGLNAAKRAQALLDKMQQEDVEPNAQTFNSAITAWSRSGSRSAAKKAESLLKNMETQYEAGNSNLEPSAFIYTSVISAWAKSNEPGSALRAEVLLKLMWVMYKRGKRSMKPNTHTFTSVINAWARSSEKNSGDRAEALLNQMIEMYKCGDSDVKPNVLTFTAAIDAYARAGGRDAAINANNILKKMDALKIKPNVKTYNVLISAWANSQQQGAGKMAESILRKLEKEYCEGDESMKPSVVSYTSCINAWAKSTDSGKARRAQAILERMKKSYRDGNNKAKPNTVTYTSVINACASTYGDREEKKLALKIGYKTFTELTSSGLGSPNHVTYWTFLKVLRRLMPSGEKRDAVIVAVFHKCCRDGQFDGNCLSQLKNAVPEELLRKIMGGIRSTNIANLSIDDIPLDWKKNVDCTTRPTKRKN